ncbi:MAG: OmpA family protein [Candidatus Omnitrophica bacterium]|nr:OmpA family protein [Candidatus Omnitrophota bacterium]
MKKAAVLLLVGIFAVGLNGCALNFYKGKPGQEQKIKQLTSQLEELEAAKRTLEERLSKEIADHQILLEQTKRGLVITMANDILFDSGKAKLKKNAYPVLDKIAVVLNEEVADRDVGVEGHTDTVPIKHSGWKSNWELSSARATNVLHYLIGKGVRPQRLSSIGYGEYKPIDTNETKVGRGKNRRVEIIILPREITKKSYEEEQSKMSEEAKAAEESKLPQGTATESVK